MIGIILTERRTSKIKKENVFRATLGSLESLTNFLVTSGPTQQNIPISLIIFWAINYLITDWKADANILKQLYRRCLLVNFTKFIRAFVLLLESVTHVASWTELNWMNWITLFKVSYVIVKLHNSSHLLKVCLTNANRSIIIMTIISNIKQRKTEL